MDKVKEMESQNQDIRDRLLTLLLSEDIRGSLSLARGLGILQGQLVLLVEDINREKPGLIMKFPGSGDDDFLYRLDFDSVVYARDFLKEGGFTALQQKYLKETKRKEIQREREEQLSALQIKDLLRLQRDAPLQKFLSISAILISLAALIISLYKKS